MCYVFAQFSSLFLPRPRPFPVMSLVPKSISLSCLQGYCVTESSVTQVIPVEKQVALNSSLFIFPVAQDGCVTEPFLGGLLHFIFYFW
jgi:hypothetical protein